MFFFGPLTIVHDFTLFFYGDLFFEHRHVSKTFGLSSILGSRGPFVDWTGNGVKETGQSGQRDRRSGQKLVES